MRNYIFKRLLYLIPIFFGITFLTFFLIQLPSDDAVDILYANSAVSEAVKAQERAVLGLDKAFFTQYFDWLVNMLTGDAGFSYISGQPVTDIFLSKLPATLFLTFSALALTLLAALPLGTLAALRHNKFTDYLIRLVSFTGNALPMFFTAFILMYIFSLKLHLLPVISRGRWQDFILPVITLAFPMTAKYIRYIRAQILEERRKDYVYGALMRGISYKTIFWRYIFKSVLLSLISVLALSIGSLLGGTAIIESIFLIDGIGKMAVDAVLMRDYPIVQMYVVWTSFIFTVINLLADLLARALNPQISFNKQGGERID